jgi:hypothetical protein
MFDATMRGQKPHMWILIFLFHPGYQGSFTGYHRPYLVSFFTTEIMFVIEHAVG